MNQCSLPTPERARKNVAAALQGLASRGQKGVADAIGVSEATVTRWKEADLERAARICAECGIKWVPVSMKCFDPKDIEALMHGHRRWVESLRTSSQLERGDVLTWEDA